MSKLGVVEEPGTPEQAEDRSDDEHVQARGRRLRGRGPRSLWTFGLPPSDCRGGDPPERAQRMLNRCPAAPTLPSQRIERLADEELMAVVDRKQAAAFEVLYDRHGGAAYSLAYRIVGDRTAAEDVTQEAFLSIWRSNARFDRARGSVRSWVLERRPQPGDRRAPPRRRARRPSSTTTTTACSRPAPRRSAPRPRRSGARPRASCAGALRELPDGPVPGDPARLLRRLQPLRDRRDARACRWAPSRGGCGSASRRSACSWRRR